MLVILNISSVRAEDSPIVIQGETWIQPEDEQLAIVKISTEQKIGVISGKIEFNGEISDIIVKGINDWNVTYNSDTKEFTIYKAEGSAEEDFMEIIYTAGKAEGKVKIILKDVQMTTITSYETIQIPNEIVKEIEVKYVNNEDNDPSEDDNDSDGDNNNSEDNKDNNSDHDGSNKDDISSKDEKDKNTTSSEGKNNKDKNNQQEIEDNTIKNRILPKAGMTQKVLLLIISLFAIMSAIGYCIYKRYKGI